ncbi:DUF3576 domain-containing protein [Candidatus Pelagibacter sp.]|uniref:DUF3576 domain-containing protein n=1 Tax=Candidatus Pelagibacter sp. TaxID=2024849 RepID=UPI003F84E66A
MFSQIKIKHILFKFTGLFLILINLNSCGIYRPVSARDYPPEPEKRIKKNLEEGRGFTIMGQMNKKGGGDFDFATSNEMWRASLDILDFMPLTSADYGGGLIITDWYSDQSNVNDSIKISIRFLSNEIRADALKINVFSKKCERTVNCKISQSNPKIENELKVAILKRAAKYKKDIIDSNPKRSLNSVLAPSDRN